jgi:GNAT superfamily N-acetyltransferase
MLRPAQEGDLAQVYEVFYQNEILGHPNPPARGDMSAYLRHVLHTGTLVVAEQDDAIVGYAGAITRGAITFLTDLFVLPAHQSGQLGKALLQAAMPQDGLTHFTVSSSDPRAQALYIRAGMAPRWPCFELRLEQPGSLSMPADLDISQVEPHDADLLRWDAQISGRTRPQDHLHWTDKERAVPLWFRRGGQTIGYAYVRLGGGTLWYPQACSLGPIGVSNAADAAACVLAAVAWASQRADVIRVMLPGPHPALAPLLERGFRIAYVDTFMSGAPTPFFDARCYVPSGGDLF